MYHLAPSSGPTDVECNEAVCIDEITGQITLNGNVVSIVTFRDSGPDTIH